MANLCNRGVNTLECAEIVTMGCLEKHLLHYTTMLGIFIYFIITAHLLMLNESLNADFTSVTVCYSHMDYFHADTFK